MLYRPREYLILLTHCPQHSAFVNKKHIILSLTLNLQHCYAFDNTKMFPRNFSRIRAKEDSQELTKWQEKYATRDPETAKQKRGRRNESDHQTYSQKKKNTGGTWKRVTLVIKNSQTQTSTQVHNSRITNHWNGRRPVQRVDKQSKASLREYKDIKFERGGPSIWLDLKNLAGVMGLYPDQEVEDMITGATSYKKLLAYQRLT